MSVTVDTEAAASGLGSQRIPASISFFLCGVKELPTPAKCTTSGVPMECNSLCPSAHLHYITVASAAVRTLPVTCGSITRHVEWQVHANHC